MFNIACALSYDDLRRWSPEDIQKYDELCVLEGSFNVRNDIYLPVIQDLLANGIHEVVDIGCGSAAQAYLFRAANIRYIGIDNQMECLTFGPFREEDGSVLVKLADWPCEIPEAKGISTCVAMHSIGSRVIKHLAPMQIAAVKRRFNRFYLASFPDTQATAQQIFGSTKHWIHPTEDGAQWIQICERRKPFPQHIKDKLFANFIRSNPSLNHIPIPTCY